MSKGLIPDTLTVRIDRREKDLVPFPKTLEWSDDRGHHQVFTVAVQGDDALTSGDFTLAGYERIVAVERKKGLQELRSNLFSADRPRFNRAAQRLIVSTAHPWLWLEMPSTKAWKIVHGDQAPGQVLDALFRFCGRRGIQVVIYAGACSPTERLAMGETMLRLMWSTVWEHLQGTTARPKETAATGEPE